MRERLEALRRDEAAALRIHDSVTGNLAYIAMVLEVRASEAREDIGAGREDDAQVYEMLNVKVSETLRQVRRIMDSLREQGSQSSSQTSSLAVSRTGDSESDRADLDRAREMARQSFGQLLQQEARCSDGVLRQLGFKGHSAIDMPERILANRDQQEAAMAFLREMYTNIAVHGSVGGHYEMMVDMSDGRIVIDSSNDSQGVERFVSKPHSGMGLALHSQAVERLGGHAVYGRENGTWHIHMEMPLCTDWA